MFKSDRPNDRQRQNRLAGEKSPYLLQHADNPVDWYPWGEEAFTRARAENKPIFLSIGYSTCHWCHVMAHESFEDEKIAALMNREFINIKVDREERPDVDRVYMTFVQATTGHGGWPMSVWLTPDLHPFVGGTYFPPEDRYGQPGFPSVLQKIAAAWRADRDRIAGQGARIIEALREAQTKSRGSSGAIDPAAIEEAFSQFSGSFDAAEGGFGNAPKFPHPVTLNFLTRFYAGHRDSDDRKRALEMLTFTLGKMAAGGMDDHLGGGFHRYSVDRYWHVPHFEKMLYDQAQLAVAYLEVFQITADPEFASVARDVLDYVARDMTSKEGAFFSAEDADSPDPENPAHNTEGAFYVWTRAEIDSALGKEADLFCFHYGVEAEGNAPSGSDPHGELSGKNVLILRHTIPETAAHFKREEKEVAQSLTTSRQTLWAVREKRPRPHRDDKIITAWNGLMISAFARAGAVLSERRYIDLAACAAEWLRTHVWDDGVLYRSYREGRSAVEGFADDYAFLIQGLVDLYEATFDLRWLEWANELQTKQDELFWDDENGGYFSTTGRDASVMLRMKEENDGAEPAPSSVAAQNLLRLSQYENRPEWRKQAEKTVAAFQTMLSHYPSAMPQMLGVVDALSRSSRQIVIAGTKDAADTGALVAEVQRHFLPNKVLLLADGGESQKYFGERLPEIGEMKPVGEKAAAYVCENFTCQAAVTDPQELGRVLSR